MKGKVICYSYRNKYRKRLARDKVTEKCGKILDKRYCSFFKLFSDFIFLSKKLGKKGDSSFHHIQFFGYSSRNIQSIYTSCLHKEGSTILLVFPRQHNKLLAPLSLHVCLMVMLYSIVSYLLNI